MTHDQARRLQDAVREQTNQRNRLIAAANPEEIADAAERYLEATDACYLAACDIRGQTP